MPAHPPQCPGSPHSVRHHPTDAIKTPGTGSPCISLLQWSESQCHTALPEDTQTCSVLAHDCSCLLSLQSRLDLHVECRLGAQSLGLR